MEQKYRPGDIAYIVANSIFIKEVMVLKISGGFVTLRFMEGGGAARLRESRCGWYSTKRSGAAWWSM